jgi:hypothetical protein
MYWPKFSMDKLQRLLRRRRSSVGASCAYIKWTKYVGIKMYSERSQRNRCHRLQNRAEKVGLSPKTGERFEFRVLAFDLDDCTAPDLRWCTIYCYWTEHVKLPRLTAAARKKQLQASLEEIGIHHSDLSRYNIGTKNRKLICIDFDSCSCEEC